MGYKQRERKRRQRAAKEARRVASRASGSSASKWWLTIAVQDGCCARCGGMLRVGREVVYRHVPRETLCTSCAESAGVEARPSLRWERERARRRGGGRR